MKVENSEVEKLLNDFANVNSQLAQIIDELRKLVLSSAEGSLEERVKYGGVVFLKNGDVLGGIFLRKSFVTLEFSDGYKLADEDGLLEGKGKYRRNLKFYDVSDIQAKSAHQFIELAYGVK